MSTNPSPEASVPSFTIHEPTGDVHVNPGGAGTPVPRFFAVIERHPDGGWLVRVYNASNRLQLEATTRDDKGAGEIAVETIQQLECGCIIL